MRLSVDDSFSDMHKSGYTNLGKVLSDEEVEYFLEMFDRDRTDYPYFWHPYGYHQHANYEALVTSPGFDELIRHPVLYSQIRNLMGGDIAFGEIGLRYMGPYKGKVHQQWHRDRGHFLEHPLRMDYMQLIVYLTDVDTSTHCLSISPESVNDKPLKNMEAQLERGGKHDICGPAGTCALFNVALAHTATTRPTEAVRKSVQIYYGHRNRAPLANDSAIPATFWRDHPDPETRGFYGLLNERTRILNRAFGASEPK